MTTIAYRDGILAADSRETSGDEDSGQLATQCQKMFGVGPHIVALQGETTPGMAWLHWFRVCMMSAEAWRNPLSHTPADIIDRFLEHDADFTAVVLTPHDGLWIYDEWGVPQKITAPYYAVGSGAKAALGAMFAGATATQAVLAACEHDPYTSGPVQSSENL